MTDTTTAGTTADTSQLNGSGPAPGPADDAGCADCASGGEKALAVIGGVVGALIVGMAIDMFTGGALSATLARMLGRAEPEQDGAAGE